MELSRGHLTLAEWGFLLLLTAFLCWGHSAQAEHGTVPLEASEQQLFPVIIDTANKIKKMLLL